MQKEDIKEILIDFGLSEHEALVYLSSLMLGPSTVNKIAKHSGVKRTTVYPVVESLKRKGIMNIQLKGLKNLFVAESPERLEKIIEQKKERLKSMIPELSALYNLKGGESLIKYYEGVEGVKTIYEDIYNTLRPNDEYLITSDLKKFLNIDKDFFTKFIEKRAKLNLRVRTILQNNDIDMFYKKNEQNFNFKAKVFEPNIDLKANVAILPTKIYITQLIEPYISIVIENKNIVDMHRQYFNIMWDAIKDE